MTPRKKQESQKPPESKAEDGPFTFSNQHIQQTAVQAAWTHQAQNAAQTAAEIGSTLGGSRAAWLAYQVPASETKVGQKRLQEYYVALGRFTDMFSQVETAIALTLWYYAKCTKDIAKTIFAGTRIVVSSSYIKQLAKVTGAKKELQYDLEYILQQLGDINSARNDIVHFGAASIAEGDGSLKVKEDPWIFPIAPTLLDEMTADLNKIIFHLRNRHYAASLGHGKFDRVLQTPPCGRNHGPKRLKISLNQRAGQNRLASLNHSRSNFNFVRRPVTLGLIYVLCYICQLDNLQTFPTVSDAISWALSPA